MLPSSGILNPEHRPLRVGQISETRRLRPFEVFRISSRIPADQTRNRGIRIEKNQRNPAAGKKPPQSPCTTNEAFQATAIDEEHKRYAPFSAQGKDERMPAAVRIADQAH